MPVFQIGLDDGRSLQIEADDQAAALAGVQHFQATEKSEKPSGIGAGFAHGVSQLATDIGSTLGLGGVKSEKLDKLAAATAPKDYKGAPLIREGGHWYNLSDYQPGNIPQMMSEQVPGLAMDMAAGKTGASVGSKVGGVRGAVIGGVGSTLASIAARTFGPGAHENADARAGAPNSPVTKEDLLREAGKQTLAAPLNALGGARLAGVVGPAKGVGLEGAGKALNKYLATVGAEGAAGGSRDVISQVGSTVGTDKGIQYDPNRTAEAVVGGGAGAGALVAPRLIGKLHNSSKFSEFGGDNAAASEALANRQIEAANGKKLVGALGGTRTAAEATNAAHADVKTELNTASKGLELSQENTNTLERIKSGGKANARELTALEAEAPPEVAHLARQAMLSNKLRGMGNLEEGKFTGGLSGLMEEKLKPLYNPTATGAATIAGIAGHAGAMGTIGMSAPPILAGVYGSYLAARALDKLTGARSPAKGFTDTFANPDAPIRTTPQAPEPEARTTSVPQIAPPQDTQLWGRPAPEVTGIDANGLNTQVKSALLMAAARRKIAEASAPEGIDANSLNTQVKSALLMSAARRKLEGQRQAEEVAADSHTINEQGGVDALSNPAFAKRGSQLLSAANVMRRLTAEPTPEPVTADVPAPAPVEPPPVVISPIAKKMLQEKLKQGLPPEPAPEPPAPAPAPQVPSFNPTALAMLKQKLKVGLPPAPAPPAPAAQAASPVIPEGPASQAIGDLMAHLRAKSGAPPVAPVAPAPAEAAPVSPLMEKITKKSGKKAEAHPEENSYVPMDAEQLWGRGMHDDAFAAQDRASKSDLKYPDRYEEGIVRDRKLRRNAIGEVLGDDVGPDSTHAVALLEELHHTRRADKAHAAIKHFTAKMSPGMRAAMRKRLGNGFVSGIWKR